MSRKKQKYGRISQREKEEKKEKREENNKDVLLYSQISSHSKK